MSPPPPAFAPGPSFLLAAAAAGSLFAASCGGEPPSQSTAPTVPVLRIVTVTPGTAPTRAPDAAGRYVVEQGDTLSGIAARFGVTEDALLRANALADRDLLFAGQELTIPAP